MISSRRARVSPVRRLHRRFFWIGVVGVAAIAFFVVREVRSIREASRAYEEDPASAYDSGRGAAVRPGERTAPRIVLQERRRAEPGIPGRYVLSVDGMRWELETPAADADEARWDAWEAATAPRWAALELSLAALANEDPDVRAEILTPWADEPDRAPKAFLVRLLATLGRAGILDVDVSVGDE